MVETVRISHWKCRRGNKIPGLHPPWVPKPDFQRVFRQKKRVGFGPSFSKPRFSKIVEGSIGSTAQNPQVAVQKGGNLTAAESTTTSTPRQPVTSTEYHQHHNITKNQYHSTCQNHNWQKERWKRDPCKESKKSRDSRGTPPPKDPGPLPWKAPEFQLLAQ